MKTNDYVKYITQTFVKYMDQPIDERKKLREEKKDTKGSFSYRWFGILPLVLSTSLKRNNKKSS